MDETATMDRESWARVWDLYVRDRHSKGDHDNCAVTSRCIGGDEAEAEWYREEFGIRW